MRAQGLSSSVYEYPTGGREQRADVSKYKSEKKKNGVSPRSVAVIDVRMMQRVRREETVRHDIQDIYSEDYHTDSLLYFSSSE